MDTVDTIVEEQTVETEEHEPAQVEEVAPAEPETAEAQPEQPAEIQLSDEQQEGVRLFELFLENPDRLEFRLGGYAGTGKTTWIKRICAILEERNIEFAVASFTGKAVSVLRKKGVRYAQTLHSLLYDTEYDPWEKRIKFLPKWSLAPLKIVIVDEASMVSTVLYDELTKHRIKVVYVGDPAQLEPVGDNPDLMRRCDFVFETIHRQASQSPILRLAQAVRRGMTNIPYGEWPGLNVTNDPRVFTEYEFDVAICGKNVTRHRINRERRRHLGFSDTLQSGETIVVLANSRDFGVFNGMTLTVKEVKKEGRLDGQPCLYVDLEDDIGDTYDFVPVHTKFFGQDYKREDAGRGKVVPVDYGYCLTAHKSQGSEWDKVLVIDEPLWKSDICRWRYTAITRAAKELVYLK